jgi:probable phosphoglycerate mutase
MEISVILYLIRHGQTDQNKRKMLQGGSNIELNDNGREMARQAADKLKDVPIDIAFSSPLIRARETVDIILEGRDIPIIEDVRLREISFGIYEGLCYHKDFYTIPDKDFMNFFDAPHLYKAPENGEEIYEVIHRTKDFVEELKNKDDYKEKSILISTHGCALRALLAGINDTPIRDLWGKGVPGNCEVVTVKIE